MDPMDPMEEVPESPGEVDATDSQSPLLTYPPVTLSAPAPESGHRPSGSFDSMRLGSESSGDDLLRRTMSVELLRSLGDAPPYEPSSSEMVELGTGVTRSPSATRAPHIDTATATAPTTDPTTASSTQSRPSGFRRMISRFMPTGPANPSTNANPSGNPSTSRIHARTGSNATTATTRSHPQSTHARSHSRSDLPSRSTLSLLHLSRSTLSLNNPANHPELPNSSTNLSTINISAPLAHTLVRTNFVYPSSGLGLTDEQVKFISSVEVVGKYGVPYGEQAVMARSREVLGVEGEGPPPPFEVGAEQSPSRDQGGEPDGREDGTRTMPQLTSDSSPMLPRVDVAESTSPSSPTSASVAGPSTTTPTTVNIESAVQARPLLKAQSSTPVPMSASTIQTFHTAQDDDHDRDEDDERIVLPMAGGGGVGRGRGDMTLLDPSLPSPSLKLTFEAEDEDDPATPTQVHIPHES